MIYYDIIAFQAVVAADGSITYGCATQASDCDSNAGQTCCSSVTDYCNKPTLACCKSGSCRGDNDDAGTEGTDYEYCAPTQDTCHVSFFLI